MDIIEQCRQACGGHGYSSYAGLPGLYQDFVVQNTWEGDNTVLTLQTGRYLLGCFKAAVKDKKTVPVPYINRLPSILKASAPQGDPTSLATIGDAFDAVSANLLAVAGKAFMEALQKGKSEEAAHEDVGTLFGAQI